MPEAGKYFIDPMLGIRKRAAVIDDVVDIARGHPGEVAQGDAVGVGNAGQPLGQFVVQAHLVFESETRFWEYALRLTHAANDTLVFADERYRIRPSEDAETPFVSLGSGQHETRLDEQDLYAAWVTHTLTVSDGKLKIKLKRVDLVNCDAALRSIQLFM